MKFKILGSLIIGAMLVLGGCNKGGSEQEKNGDQQDTQQEQGQGSDQQQMLQQMEQQQDIEVSDKEIEQFVEAAMEVQSLSMQMQQEMSKMVQDEGMEPQRFSEISRAQNSQQQGEAGASDEEMETYRKIMEQMQDAQSSVQEDMEKVIEDEGLSMERYQQIAGAAQQDSSLMQRLQEKMQKSMEGAPQQGR